MSAEAVEEAVYTPQEQMGKLVLSKVDATAPAGEAGAIVGASSTTGSRSVFGVVWNALRAMIAAHPIVAAALLAGTAVLVGLVVKFKEQIRGWFRTSAIGRFIAKAAGFIGIALAFLGSVFGGSYVILGVARLVRFGLNAALVASGTATTLLGRIVSGVVGLTLMGFIYKAWQALLTTVLNRAVTAAVKVYYWPVAPLDMDDSSAVPAAA